MAGRHAESQPTWTDVKSKLASFDRAGLLSLLHDLYAANKDNQAFLHARFGLGEDALDPYKKTLERWLWPDVFRKQDTSVVNAKQAISNYKKAVGEASGLAELMVTYCELATGYSRAIVHDDESYFDALVRMFEQALKIASTLPDSGRNALYGRLDQARGMSQAFGYGVGDDMDSLFPKYAKSKT